MAIYALQLFIQLNICSKQQLVMSFFLEVSDARAHYSLPLMKRSVWNQQIIFSCLVKTPLFACIFWVSYLQHFMGQISSIIIHRWNNIVGIIFLMQLYSCDMHYSMFVWMLLNTEWSCIKYPFRFYILLTPVPWFSRSLTYVRLGICMAFIGFHRCMVYQIFIHRCYFCLRLYLSEVGWTYWARRKIVKVCMHWLAWFLQSVLRLQSVAFLPSWLSSV